MMLSAWRMWDVRPGVSLVFRKCEVGNGGVKSGGSGKKAFFLAVGDVGRNLSLAAGHLSPPRVPSLSRPHQPSPLR